MSRKKTTNSTVIEATESTVASTAAVDKNIEEVTIKKEKKNVALNDYDEIKVVSLIPNVSYKDSHTDDLYKWEEIGHIEDMTFETIKNMWRSSKGYFKNMCLKPLDDRVIKKFGLTSIFEKHEFLMNETNYTRENISKICESISGTPNGMKFTICNKIKNLVVSGKITDIAVIRALEKHLNLDLTSFLN